MASSGRVDPAVSAVIVTWNSSKVIRQMLDSLAPDCRDGVLEVIVVDNGSTDGSAELAATHQTAPRVIRNETNRGLPAANNQGLAASSGNSILIANPDTVLAPGALRAMVAVLDHHERAGFVIPRLRYEDGTLQTSAGDLPTFVEALRGRQHQRSHASDRGFWWDDWSHDEERAIGRGHECCYLVRRRCWEEVGDQDESYTLDWEGIDWSARCRDAGWEIWFTPAAEVVHLGGASIRQVPMRWVVSSHRGMYRYFASRSSAALRPGLAIVVTARAAMKALALLLGRVNYEQGHRAPK